MRFSAVIFDLDGTILINEQVYARTFLDILKKHGVDVKNEDKPHTLGIGLDANWVKMKLEYPQLKDLEVNLLVHETQDLYHSRLDDVVIRPGFFELHEALKEVGISIALATSNNWWLIEDELDDLDLHKYFEAIVTGEEVLNKKPEPDIFLVAANKLNVDPEECIVIEDSPAGVIAGYEAGMKVIAVLNEGTEEEDFPKADKVVEGFEEINPKMLDALYFS